MNRSVYRDRSLQVKAVLAGCLFALQLTGCHGKDPVTPISPPATKSQPVATIAARVAKDYGKVVDSGVGTSGKQVIVFEEVHTSRLGHLEIALMLTRLANQACLGKVELEGAMADNGRLSADWLQASLKKTDTQDAARGTVVRLLREGEINAGEFIAATRPDVEVVGSEVADQYNVNPPSQSAAYKYLLTVAFMSLSDAQRTQLDSYLQSGDKQKASDLLESVPEVKDLFAQLAKSPTMSAEETLAFDKAVQAKADEVSAPVSDSDKDLMQQELAYDQVTIDRSVTMANNSLSTCDAVSGTPVAMIVGAAHTDGVVSVLKQGGASYVVISPASFKRDALFGGLSPGAFHRKEDGKSIDTAGAPGAILDGRAGHLPPPVLETTWLERKANIYQATDLISRAFAAGANPPFNDQSDALGQLDGITIDPTSYQPFTLPNGKRGLLFKITVQVGDSADNKKDIWVASSDGQPPKPPVDPVNVVTPEPPEDNDPVEKLLQDGIEGERQVERGESADGKHTREPDHPTSDANELIALSDKTMATFADDPETAQRNMEAAG